MPNQISKCPICGWEAEVTHLGDVDLVKCALCGEFKVVRSLLATSFSDKESEEAKGLLPYLAAHTRQANQRGEVVTLDTRNWKELALAHKNTPLPRKITKLLELIASRARPGNTVQLNAAAEAPLVDAESKTEMMFLLSDLVKREYLREVGGGNYLIEVKGWEQLQPTTGIPGKCFVAMSFHKDLKDAYEKGIFLAVKEDCKMDPVRMDLVEHNEKICDRMVAEIRTCQFLVADVTRQRANVYFEGGFAMGLGRPVIWTCSEDDRKEVHFDTRQYNHIFWKDPKDLRTKLRDRIKATILT
jgi:hypothetical protein